MGGISEKLQKLKSKFYIIAIVTYIVLFTFSFSITKVYWEHIDKTSTAIDNSKFIAATTEAFSLNIKQNRGTAPIILPADDNKNSYGTARLPDRPINAKEVFLTFDDGPSRRNTDRILDLLQKNDVKATFFVVGSSIQGNTDIIKRMNDSGMAIFPHCYNHDYSIYKTEQTYFDDLNRCTTDIRNQIGNVDLPFVRMPGGSDNEVSRPSVLKSIKASLKAKNIYYVDWNVTSGDADANFVRASTIRNNVINRGSGSKMAVVLMHDAPAKTTTVDALQGIITFFKNNGYVFRTFKDLSQQELEEMEKRRIIDR